MQTFRALADRDFRLYFIGQVVSLVGTWVQQVAMSWIAYRVTGSAFMLGLVAFSGQIPMLVLSPLGGTLADRLDRRNLLVITQVVAMAVAAWLAVIAFNSDFSSLVLIAAALLQGTSNAMEMPTRQAFLQEIVHDRSHITNAIALNSLTFNGARVVGPAVGGAIPAAFGETACFVINAVSFVAAIFTLLALHPQQADRQGRGGPLRERVEYLKQFAPARWLLITVAAASLCVSPLMTFMPVYAKDIFHGGPDTFGMLMGASGLGAVLAGLYLAHRKSIAGIGERITWSCFVTGIASIAFAYNPFIGGAIPLLVASGGATIFIVTSSNMLLQLLVPENLRGRLMALFTMSFIGMLPLGALGAGSLAHIVGAPPLFVLTGTVAIVTGCVLKRKLPYLRDIARPVLKEKGHLSS